MSETQTAYYPRLDPALVRLMLSDYNVCATNPVMRDIVVQPPGVLVRDELAISSATRKTHFWNELWLPAAGDHALGSWALLDGSLCTMFNLQQPRPFEEDALDVCNAVLPHVQRALRVGRQLEAATARAAAALDVLHALRTGVVLVDKKSRVTFVNRCAEAIIATADGLTIARGVLIASRRADQAVLGHLIAQCASGSGACRAGGDVDVCRPSGLQPYAVLVSPLGRSSMRSAGTDPAAAVFITDPETKGPPSAAALRRRHQLTPAEAAIAAYIVRGSGVPAAAAALGISANTARTHLKRIFAKTGTHRQAELVRLLCAGGATDV
jgi:DNA-binding CsgD family transcriptional regulator